MSMKNSNDTSWDRTSDLPICGTAPNPMRILYHMLMCRQQNNMKLANKILENVLKFKYFATILTIRITFTKKLGVD